MSDAFNIPFPSRYDYAAPRRCVQPGCISRLAAMNASDYCFAHQHKEPTREELKAFVATDRHWEKPQKKVVRPCL